MMRAEQYNRVANLTPSEVQTVLRYHPTLTTTDDEPSLPLLMRLIAQHGMDQRHLLRPMLRATDPTAVHAIETIVGRPITRITRAIKHQQPTRLTRAPRPKAADNRTILSVLPNPKKPGSASFDRYAKYQEGITVSDALSRGLTPGDIKWDVDHGHIVLT